jgi:iron complex transport system substrate-binding protein
MQGDVRASRHRVAPLAIIAALAVLACQSRPAPTPAPAPAPAAQTSATPDAAPLRLVSLTPSATEVVAALDATALLVGVDDYSSFPAEVGKLPKVGSFLAPNLEVIIGLKPSLVIVDDVHSQVAGALHDAGVATVACAIHDLPDIKSALTAVGAQLGRADQAARVVAGIDAALDHAAAARPAHRPRVLAVIDREADGLGNLVAAGPGSWVDELLAVVGGDNVLAAAGTRYPKISVEEVIRSRPDVILDLSYAARQTIAPWQTLKVPAVAANRIRALQDPYLIAPSPRVADALTALTRAISE